jgi:hypothetical protein
MRYRNCWRALDTSFIFSHRKKVQWGIIKIPRSQAKQYGRDTPIAIHSQSEHKPRA